MSEFALHAKLKENYDSYYEGESPWRALGANDKVRNIVGACSARRHDDVLEIGAGDGAILKGLADRNFGKRLFALEISESAVSTVRNRHIPGVQDCRMFNGYDVPYDDGRFDLAILSHVIEHAEYPRKLLYEASRVADVVFIEVPLEDTMRLKSDFVFDAVGHINFFTWKTIRLLVQSCGLRVLSQRITNPSRAVYRYRSGVRGVVKHAVREVFSRASPRLASELFTYHCAIVCTRADR